MLCFSLQFIHIFLQIAPCNELFSSNFNFPFHHEQQINGHFILKLGLSFYADLYEIPHLNNLVLIAMIIYLWDSILRVSSPIQDRPLFDGY